MCRVNSYHRDSRLRDIIDTLKYRRDSLEFPNNKFLVILTDGCRMTYFIIEFVNITR